MADHLKKEKVDVAFWGRLGNLDSTQQDALQEFLNKIESGYLTRIKYNVETNEQFALRFLRARKFDVEKSLKLIDECISILDKYDADGCAEKGAESCADCDPDVLTTFYPHTQGGIDKEGRLLMWEANGCVSLSALQACCRPENLIKYHFWTMQNKLNTLFDNSDDNPNGSDTKVICTTAVLDFDGLNMSHLSQKMFNHLKVCC